MEKLTHSPQETKELAKGFAEKLKGSEVLVLTGDLGSGKTTFAQGLAEGLGIKERVLSPTFLLERSYQGRLKLYHFDFYRLSSSQDLEPLDLESSITTDAVVVIEWPERVNFQYPKMKKIYFEFVDEGKRRISW